MFFDFIFSMGTSNLDPDDHFKLDAVFVPRIGDSFQNSGHGLTMPLKVEMKPVANGTTMRTAVIKEYQKAPLFGGEFLLRFTNTRDTSIQVRNRVIRRFKS